MVAQAISSFSAVSTRFRVCLEQSSANKGKLSLNLTATWGKQSVAASKRDIKRREIATKTHNATYNQTKG
jgi:hypothetical protein